MRLHFLTLLFSLFFNGGSNVSIINKQENENEIYYNKNRKLKWSDFITTKSNGSVASETSSGMYIILSYDKFNNVDKINVACVFSKKESWVDVYQKNEYILNHEQRHFDISYIYTKKLVSLLDGVTDKNEVYSIYYKTIEEMNNFQDKYDFETKNSRIKENQKKWDEKIDFLLK